MLGRNTAVVDESRSIGAVLSENERENILRLFQVLLRT